MVNIIKFTGPLVLVDGGWQQVVSVPCLTRDLVPVWWWPLTNLRYTGCFTVWTPSILSFHLYKKFTLKFFSTVDESLFRLGKFWVTILYFKSSYYLFPTNSVYLFPTQKYWCTAILLLFTAQYCTVKCYSYVNLMVFHSGLHLTLHFVKKSSLYDWKYWSKKYQNITEPLKNIGYFSVGFLHENKWNALIRNSNGSHLAWEYDLESFISIIHYNVISWTL